VQVLLQKELAYIRNIIYFWKDDVAVQVSLQKELAYMRIPEQTLVGDDRVRA
jgi:hypothetical protein